MNERKRTRLDPNERRTQILAAAIHLARTDGYNNITREAIADEAGCATGLVSQYFGTMTQMRRAIMRAAVHQGVLEIIGQGLTANDPQAQKAPHDLKRRAMERLIHD